MAERRAYGSGTLFFSRGRWIYSRSFQVGRHRIRRTVSGLTPEEALGRAHEIDPEPSRKRLWKKRHGNDHQTARVRRARALDYLERVVLESRTNGWNESFTAGVILATLRPHRIRRGIFGPCVYCGSWLASEVDHIIPRAAGGSDERDNLTSACKSCNSSKGDRQGWAA